MMSKLTLLLLMLFLQSFSTSGNYLSCPLGWITYKGSSFCYRAAVKPTAKWNEARKACLAMGGDLVKIRSAQENRYVALLGRTYYPSWNSLMWIGLVGDSNNVFIWVDGSALTGQYSNWSEREPNNYKAQVEDCGMIYLKTMKWNDNVCDYHHPMTYICEKEKFH